MQPIGGQFNLLVKQLRDTSSKLDKVRIAKYLKPYEKLLNYIYSPYKNYYYSPSIQMVSALEEPTEELYQLLDKMNERKLSGKAAQQAVFEYQAKHGNLIIQVLRRSLDAGVSNKLLAEAGIALPKFDIMLAKEATKSHKRVYPLYAQTKYDGVRLLYNTTTQEFFTRSGKKFTSPQFTSLFPKLEAGYILDGEVVLRREVQDDRQVISGYINRLLNQNHTGVPFDTFNYKLFDIIPIYQFELGNCCSPYRDRFALLQAKLLNPTKCISVADTQLCQTAEEIDDLYESIIANGGEGLILKTPNHIYSYKRDIAWEKLKATYSETFTVVDIEEGSGKYEGMIGALVVENKTLKIKCRVGSGLSDEQRSWSASHWMYKEVDILFNTITSDKLGRNSLFLPRLDKIRYNFDR